MRKLTDDQLLDEIDGALDYYDVNADGRMLLGWLKARGVHLEGSKEVRPEPEPPQPLLLTEPLPC